MVQFLMNYGTSFYPSYYPSVGMSFAFNDGFQGGGRMGFGFNFGSPWCGPDFSTLFSMMYFNNMQNCFKSRPPVHRHPEQSYGHLGSGSGPDHIPSQPVPEHPKSLAPVQRQPLGDGHNESLGYPPASSDRRSTFESDGKWGRIWGDPHVVDPDGGTRDFHGESGKTYNAFRSRNVNLDTKLISPSANYKPGDPTFVGEADLTVGNNRFWMGPKSAPTLNGKALKDGQAVEYDTGLKDDGGNAVFGKSKWDEKAKFLEVNAGSSVFKFEQKDGKYLDVNTSKTNLYDRSKLNAQGYLGQTFDAAQNPNNGVFDNKKAFEVDKSHPVSTTYKPAQQPVPTYDTIIFGGIMKGVTGSSNVPQSHGA